MSVTTIHRFHCHMCGYVREFATIEKAQAEEKAHECAVLHLYRKERWIT